MLNTKPTLQLKDLIAFSKYNDVNINLPENYDSIYWSTCGAQCLADLCKSLVPKNGSNLIIALPGYFCGQSIRFLRSLQTEIVFYPLTSELTPDYSQLESSLGNRELDLFVLVHYFGNVIGQSEANKFAQDKSAFFIEDCAHVIGYKNIEWLGDFLLFSPHKHFAIPSIGCLIGRINNNHNLRNTISKRKLPIKWILKQIIKSRIKRSLPEWRDFFGTAISESMNSLTPNNFVVKKAVEAFELSQESLQIRNQNRNLLIQKLNKVKNWSLFVSDNAKGSSYVLGMICDNRKIAKRRFNLLNQNYQLVMQWPDLPLEISQDDEILAQAKKWQGLVLFFFIHQQIDTSIWTRELDKALEANNF